MNETVEFIFALLLLELLLIWLAVKLQKAICRRHGKLGWAVLVFCAVSLALCCALLLLSPADISHYVVVLTDQRQHVFSSQAEMEAFLSSLKLKGMQGRKVALVENGTWAPMAAKHMRAVLDTMKNMQTLDRQVTIRSAMNTKNREELAELAQALAL